MDLVDVDGIFLLKVLWVVIKATLVLKSRKYFIFNYSHTANIMCYSWTSYKLFIVCYSSNTISQTYKRNVSSMVLRILELCFQTTFYHKIKTYPIITGFLTKLVVILCTFYFWLSTSDFWKNSSFKSALWSWFRKLNYLRIKLAHQEKENLIYSFIEKRTNSFILAYLFRVSSW